MTVDSDPTGCLHGAGVPLPCYESGVSAEGNDPHSQRKDALDAFLEQKVGEGFVIETHTETHAIIAARPKGLLARFRGGDDGRYVVEVDEHGAVTMSPAEPIRS